MITFLYFVVILAASWLVAAGLLGIALSDDLEGVRARLGYWLVRLVRAETPLDKAVQARSARYEQCVVEYLTFGFTLDESRKKASERMQAEAKAAEGVKP